MATNMTTQGERDLSAPTEERIGGPTWMPAVDIYERGGTTTILADMPGVRSEDLDVTLERRVLTIRGTVEANAPEGYRRLSREYREGNYERAFTLSDEVDRTKIQAELKNGVLRLELPRAAEASPRKISVKTD